MSALEECEREEAAILKVFSEIEAKYKTTFSEPEREVILDLGMPFAVDGDGKELPMGDASWVEKGFERFQAIATRTDAMKAPAGSSAGGA